MFELINIRDIQVIGAAIYYAKFHDSCQVVCKNIVSMRKKYLTHKSFQLDNMLQSAL